jgi:hypothetical protein
MNHPTRSSVETQRTLLPLPKGEGRGEGKVVIQILDQRNLK